MIGFALVGTSYNFEGGLGGPIGTGHLSTP